LLVLGVLILSEIVEIHYKTLQLLSRQILRRLKILCKDSWNHSWGP